MITSSGHRRQALAKVAILLVLSTVILVLVVPLSLPEQVAEDDGNIVSA